MSTVLRHNRKGSDTEILRLNSVGLSLSTIAEKLHCHPTSVTLRLKSLGVPPADTRRAFMEDIFNALPQDFQDDVAEYLATSQTRLIKDYVRSLLVADVEVRRLNAQLMAVKTTISVDGTSEIEADRVTDIVTDGSFHTSN